LISTAQNNITVTQNQVAGQVIAAAQTAQGVLNVASSQINLINGSAYSDAQSLQIRMNTTISQLVTLSSTALNNDYNSLIAYVWSQSLQKLDAAGGVVINTGQPKYIGCLNNPTAPC